ncbi:hypothetical protein EVAR_28831_1 [Eumeta japonica]|uniref:Uncharacterized protein n=1 Tax=Eumeta variegata TaxID=151549 RepID=A0A4C1WJZ0_EUMVA|nr:hypothetical protein EVAR_28831_1 [Eumeta japonica]
MIDNVIERYKRPESCTSTWVEPQTPLTATGRFCVITYVYTGGYVTGVTTAGVECLAHGRRREVDKTARVRGPTGGLARVLAPRAERPRPARPAQPHGA